MSSLLEVSNAMFKNRGDWHTITDEEKEKNAFIMNRFLSKMFPYHSALLNLKGQDPVSMLNIWYYFMADKSYPEDFWSKSSKPKDIIHKDDRMILMTNLQLDKMEDLDILFKKYPNMVKEELKWLKKSHT